MMSRVGGTRKAASDAVALGFTREEASAKPPPSLLLFVRRRRRGCTIDASACIHAGATPTVVWRSLAGRFIGRSDPDTSHQRGRSFDGASLWCRLGPRTSAGMATARAPVPAQPLRYVAAQRALPVGDSGPQAAR